ncbi:hypothetical protein [Limosilactobacillus albertensis]|uniref:Uncharacterized protein n=1 Tax=Limosilactobacillus albertensis TaxID=2759752 RepID=A0A839HDH1_9LACO|nr:hypothetical protein [Limosilactobacillus albertensis]MBB1124422.1 hypothetical protein [Limosilactobacillus albertensis]MCD7123164.1 hypothetical protein [Limosilactobacillus albertensis]
MKLDKVLNAILVTLGAVVVGLVAFTIFKPNSSSENSNYTESSRISRKNHSKKDVESSRKKTIDNRATSSQGTSITTDIESGKKPNAGKVLKFNSVEEAEAAIKQHEATCSYGAEPFYPGLVYTGTYTCKCGLKIVWWDKAVKESVDRDMESFSREGITGPGEYSYGTDDPWENNSNENDSSASAQSDTQPSSSETED